MKEKKQQIDTNRLLLAFIILWGFIIQSCGPEQADTEDTQGIPSTIIVDASDMLDHLARQHSFGDGNKYEGEWVFNNSVIEMGGGFTRKARVNTQAGIYIPQSGRYHVYVRTSGRDGYSFEVAVGNQVIAPVKSEGKFTWKKAGTLELEKGKTSVWLTRLHGYAVFDVMVLTMNENFREEDLLDQQYQGEVKLLKEYEVGRTSAAKFGDVDGDGKSDVFALDRSYSASVYNHAGDLLWKYEAPEEGADLRAQHEGPGVIWDLDQDGLAEVIHWRFLDGKECLVVADGLTGEVKYKTEWPCLGSPHNYNNYRIAIGKLHPGYPYNIIAFTDPGNTKSITAFSPELEQLWRHNDEKLKDHLGHYPYPVDLDGDGIDEVVLSTLVLNAGGEVIWDRFDIFYDNHDHVDSYRFADITGDGKPEALAAMSDLGVFVFDGMSGKVLWNHTAEHSQQIESGNFLSLPAGPQIVVNARYYERWSTPQRRLLAEIHWFDKEGNFLSKWPANPVPGNPDFVKGDWMGDGKEVLFWHRFRITDEGKGKLYFPETLYHMLDFTGDGADEIITRDYRSGFIRVYGAKDAKPTGIPVIDPDILRHKVTNHTHY